MNVTKSPPAAVCYLRSEKIAFLGLAGSCRRSKTGRLIDLLDWIGPELPLQDCSIVLAGFHGCHHNLVLPPSHHRLTDQLLGSAINRSILMRKCSRSPTLPETKFEPELVSIMRSVLESAVAQIEVGNRTPATKAKMAERILRAASDGITNPAELTAVAIEGGRQPADGNAARPGDM